MEIEKVKEIKELLRCMNGEKACTDCYINEVAQEQETFCINVIADMTLDLINELESENKRLSKELDSEWKDRRKAEEDLHKTQWHYKIGLGQSRKRNKELKDRIAELEKEIKENPSYAKGYADGIKNTYEAMLPQKLENFAERLKEKVQERDYVQGYAEIGLCEEIDETLKEFINKQKTRISELKKKQFLKVAKFANLLYTKYKITGESSQVYIFCTKEELNEEVQRCNYDS